MAERDTRLGVLPVGYGDGWRRGLSNNADVLVGGRRHPLVGTVSMDNITVDLGSDADAEELRGRRGVLIGSEGGERITAEEVARRLDTINYEVTCALTPRVPRVYHRDGVPLDRDGVPLDRDGVQLDRDGVPLDRDESPIGSSGEGEHARPVDAKRA